MVKVVQAYNFPYQITHAAATDITATTLIGKNQLAIGSSGHCIEIYNLDKRPRSESFEFDEFCVQQPINNDENEQPKSFDETPILSDYETINNIALIDLNENQKLNKHILPTIGNVIQLIYCETGPYLATLEVDANHNESRQFEQRRVRIYSNFWKFRQEELSEIPITPRIATKVTPNADIDKSIDLIELPMQQTPDIIACCQATGNIIVNSKDKIFLFEYATCMHDIQKFEYIDFLSFKFYVQLNFTPAKLIIAENVIGCIDKRYAISFKIVDISGTDTEDDTDSAIVSHISKTSLPSSSNSFETDSLETSTRPNGIANVVDFAVAQKANSVCGREFEYEMKSQWEKDESTTHCKRFSDDRPKRTSSIKIKLINIASLDKTVMQQRCNDEYNIQYDIKKLLHLSMPKPEENITKSCYHFECMDLKPIYQTFGTSYENVLDTISLIPKKRLMKSKKYIYCVGFSFLVATNVDGYLYQFCNQGKWYNENEKPIASYTFTAPIISVHIDNFVIHAITTESVETHTSRVGHKIFANRFEYPTIASLYPDESSPDVNAPVQVIGLCSFMNVKYVGFNNINLVLISGIPDSKLIKSGVVESKLSLGAISEWTIYSLKIPRPSDVVDDLEHIADTYRESSPETFYELMEEAQVILRIVNNINLNYFRGLVRLLETELEENCRKLADFSIRSLRKEIYMQATGYYKMCNIEPDEVYCDYFYSTTYKLNECSSNKLAGLLYTLKSFISTVGADKTKATFLNKVIKPIFTPASQYASSNISEVKLGIDILYLLILYSPNDITMVMLNCPIFIDIADKDLIHYLAQKREMTGDESLLLAVSTARKSKLYLSRQIIHGMSRKSLALSLIAYKHVLFDDNYSQEHPERSSFSDLAEYVLFSIDPPYLVEAMSDALISLLCIERTLSLRFIMPLFMNYFATQIGYKGYRKSQIVLSNVLQSYFYNYFDICDVGRTKSKISEDLSSTHVATTTKSLTTEEAEFGIVSGEYVLTSGKISCNVIKKKGRDDDSSSASSQDFQINTGKVQNLQSVDDVWENQVTNRGCDGDSVATSLNGNDEFIIKTNQFGGNLIVGCSSYSQTVTNALKILFRMYLGQLKQLSDKLPLTSSITKSEEHRDKSISYLNKNLYVTKSQHSKNVPNYIRNDEFLVPTTVSDLIPNYSDPNISDEHFNDEVFIRPIPCLEYRPAYLNQMEPFSESSFQQNENGTWAFVDWNNEAVVLLLKIQALLCCHKTDSSIVEEFLSYVDQTTHLIGIDSVLTILLPKHLAMDYIIAVNPELMWIYGKSQRLQPKQWEVFFRKMLQQRDIIPDWKVHLNSILSNLVTEKSFEELLQCFPTDIVTKDTSLLCKDPNLPERPVVMDNIDETNAFELILRDAVAKQRSLALRSMIESTGTQLFDAAGTNSQ